LNNIEYEGYEHEAVDLKTERERKAIEEKK
jgi:hypothetical protein